MAITPLPTPPSRSDSNDVFVARSDAFIAALPTMVTQTNIDIATTNANTAAAASSASSAAIKASDATIAANNATAASVAFLWVTGTTYTVGKVVISPANGRLYRRIVAGAGAVDPSADTANWNATVIDGVVSSVKLREVLSTLPAITIVAQNPFDNSKDSAWLDQCAGKTWYDEARSTIGLCSTGAGYATAAAAVAAGGVTGDVFYNTTAAAFHAITGPTTSSITYRAGSRKFPMKGIASTEAGRPVIWDTTGGAPTMWGVLPNVFGTISSIAILGSTLLIGSSTGLWEYDFLRASYRRRNATNLQHYSAGSFTALGTAAATETAGAIVNATVNAVAITYLPDAPVDVVTGVRKPTIAVGTAGGALVIKDDGTVVTSSYASNVGSVSLDSEYLRFNRSATAAGYDVVALSGIVAAFTALKQYTVASVPAIPGNPLFVLSSGRVTYARGTQGLSILRESPAVLTSGSAALVTSTYNTGWMVGDIRRCVGYDSASVLADKSVKASVGFAAVGTPTITPVAGSRTAVSGFSAANYLQEASHVDFNALAAGNFDGIIPGAKFGTAATLKTLICSGNGASAGSWSLEQTAANTLVFYIWNATPTKTAICTSTAAFTDTAEHTIEFGRVTVAGVADTVFIKVDGVIVASAVSTLTISNATGFLRIGEGQAVSQPWVGGQFSGYVRISATAPTAEGSLYIATTENELNGGKSCLLSNSASVGTLQPGQVSGGAYVPNGLNTDLFIGLKRVDYAVNSTGATASGLDFPDNILLQSGTVNTYRAPLVDVNSELKALGLELAEANQKPIHKMIASSAASVLTFPAGFYPTRVFSAAGTYISLSTNAPKFDGFIWYINTGLAVSTNYDCELVRVKP